MIKVQSVSSVILKVKHLLEDEFLDISVEGEITNLSASSAGHFYFTLSDANSAMSCALFKMDALRNPIIRKLKDGDKVILRGSISVYQKRGTFQLIVKRITPAGKGDLKAEYEKLKVLYTEKGYFDQSNKKSIPRLPKKIAVITALGAAALQDFLNVMHRRTHWHEITIIPATVQGDECPAAIVKALKKAQDFGKFDVVVITRGGGSLEDLWGFNDPRVVEAVYKCTLPVISAIGHQVDFTLCDFVSDLRCETPSAAAEILSQEHTQLIRRLDYAGRTLRMNMIELKSSIEKKMFKLNPVNAITLLRKNLNSYQMRLASTHIHRASDLIGVKEYFQQADELIERAEYALSRQLQKSKENVDKAHRLLETLNPENVLNRGYTIVKNDQGKVLTSHAQFATISKGDSISIKFKDGIGKVTKQLD